MSVPQTTALPTSVDASRAPAPLVSAPRLQWEVPALSKLPPLTELTLVTGGRIHGGGSGGGTVF